jgi:hypothetical protein
MSETKYLLAQYDLHNTLFNTVLAGISEEEAAIRLEPHVNNVKWLAGHLVWGQRGLAGMGGVPMDVEWLPHYDTQIKNPPGPEVPTPSLDEIKAAWNRLVEPIRAGLEVLPQEVLDKPIEFPMPAFRSVGGLWAFINHHQAYTIGQIGILRRVLGKEAMKYF